MRPAVLKAWNEVLTQKVAETLPQFSPYSRRERGEGRGMLRYKWNPLPNLWCFILFRPLDSEAFDAWVGWSTQEKSPYGLPERGEIDDFSSSNAMFCSMELVPRNGLAHWNFWDAPEESLDNPAAFAQVYAAHFTKQLSDVEARVLVEPAISHGVSEVIEFGIPYLNRRVVYGSGG